MTLACPAVRYRLSNRQLKDLRIRSTQITIALPLHPCEADELESATEQQLRTFVALSIEGLTADNVRSAELCDLTVGPGTGGGLTEMLGTIFTEATPERFLRYVGAIVTTIAVDTNPRYKQDVPQWPLMAMIGDYEYPRRDGAKGGE